MTLADDYHSETNKMFFLAMLSLVHFKWQLFNKLHSIIKNVKHVQQTILVDVLNWSA